MINKIETFRTITTKMADTYERKNNDYGSSFGNIRAKFPNAILIRLNDKLSRIESLLTGTTQMVLDEKIEDTFLDLAVYCIMELVEREQDKEYEQILKTQQNTPGEIVEIAHEHMFNLTYDKNGKLVKKGSDVNVQSLARTHRI